MNRTLASVCTAVVLSAALVGAQSQPSHNADKASDPGKNAPAASTSTVTFTGCLTPRSKADEIFLTGAKQKGVKGQATTVKLVPANKKVDLDAFVTQGVEVTGTLDQAAASATSAGGSGSTPTLTVTKVKSRDDGC
jgi:hypothetical protein